MKKSRAKFNKFKHLWAWVNGKAYTKPCYFAVRKVKRGWWIDVGYNPDTILLNVRLYTSVEVERAYRIVIANMAVGEEINI